MANSVTERSPTIRLPFDLYYKLEERATRDRMAFPPWFVVLLQSWLDNNPPSASLSPTSYRTPQPRYLDPFAG